MKTCTNCWGEGEIVDCCDDICQGLGYCIHDNGMVPCPECDGWGAVFDDDEEEYEAVWFYEDEEIEP